MPASLRFGPVASCLVAGALFLAPLPRDADERIAFTVKAGPHTRHAWAYVVSGPAPAGGRPIVVALHGAGDAVEPFRRGTRLERAFAGTGAVILYPEAHPVDGRRWSMGCAGCTPADDAGVDDPKLILDLVDSLHVRVGADPTRFAVVGFSNGGNLAAVLACRMSDRLAAVAIVAALRPVLGENACAPEHPLPVLILLGTRDPIFPWEGGPNRFGVTLVGAEATARAWARRNGCDGEPVAFTARRRADRDQETLRWENCRGGSTVELYRIEGGGHEWRIGGLPTSEVVADFFMERAWGGRTAAAGR